MFWKFITQHLNSQNEKARRLSIGEEAVDMNFHWHYSAQLYTITYPVFMHGVGKICSQGCHKKPSKIYWLCFGKIFVWLQVSFPWSEAVLAFVFVKNVGRKVFTRVIFSTKILHCVRSVGDRLCTLYLNKYLPIIVPQATCSLPWLHALTLHGMIPVKQDARYIMHTYRYAKTKTSTVFTYFVSC